MILVSQAGWVPTNSYHQVLHTFLFLFLLLWVGDSCVGLRPLSHRGREFHSHNISLVSQLPPYLHAQAFPLHISTLVISLYVASSVLLGYNISYQPGFRWLFRLIGLQFSWKSSLGLGASGCSFYLLQSHLGIPKISVHFEPLFTSQAIFLTNWRLFIGHCPSDNRIRHLHL